MVAVSFQRQSLNCQVGPCVKTAATRSQCWSWNLRTESTTLNLSTPESPTRRSMTSACGFTLTTLRALSGCTYLPCSRNILALNMLIGAVGAAGTTMIGMPFGTAFPLANACEVADKVAWARFRERFISRSIISASMKRCELCSTESRSLCDPSRFLILRRSSSSGESVSPFLRFLPASSASAPARGADAALLSAALAPWAAATSPEAGAWPDWGGSALIRELQSFSPLR
mmetsp:Transcript_19848/g.56739  ORF Transcript_19848/g.56739 Transcript_19848/m.56739 type:complete len:230 (+) Transcript_19848:266-955(+)